MRNATATETKTINIKGTRVFVAIQRGDGSRPPLLLINGIGANLEVFDPFIDALEKVGRKKIGTIRFDVPGVGGSPPLSGIGFLGKEGEKGMARRHHLL